MAKYSPAPWRLVKNRSRRNLLEVRNSHADEIAVVYSSEADGRLMAASRQMLPLLKTLATSKPYIQAWEDARKTALALIAEVTP